MTQYFHFLHKKKVFSYCVTALSKEKNNFWPTKKSELRIHSSALFNCLDSLLSLFTWLLINYYYYLEVYPSANLSMEIISVYSVVKQLLMVNRQRMRVLSFLSIFTTYKRSRKMLSGFFAIYTVFDSVDHQTLLRKFNYYGIDGAWILLNFT